ncbi:MAG TPA: AMP-binding protein [Dongiaceae bacterium]|nr:AMP-binding protein [Dongiaceae bacterium]
MTSFASIFSALQTRPLTTPDQPVISYANENGKIDQVLTWRDFADRIDAMTGFLRTHLELQPGDRVLLVYPPSVDFVLAFAGCLRAGLIPVPVYPPNPRKLDSGTEAFLRIAQDCDARLVLTNHQYELTRNRGGLQELAATDPARWSLALQWVTTDHVNAGDFPAVHGAEPTPNDVALIQYTSGSTSAPKGVVITHGNLAHQIDCACRALNIGPGSRAVFWVPQYHDLGLIGGIMNALAGNLQLTLFSPFSFIKRPALWFELMHATGATHTAGPNFAYELAVQKTTPEQRAQWDLSALEVVMSAAEPVRASTMRRFLDAFAVSGLKPQAYKPAYGLAEHTVGITYNGGTITHFDRDLLEHQQRVVKVNERAANGIALVSSGRHLEDMQLRIVNPDTSQQCAPDRVGEVWVDSPSKAAGYWKLDEQNAHAFQARIEDEADRHYLRTGDLGFLHQGELYICGRLKDMLILAGRNIYPQDIEESVQEVSGAIKPLSVAAFAVDVESGTSTEEKLVLLVDIRSLTATQQQLEQFALQLQRAVLESHQIPCHAIVVAPIGTVLKTTSGKVRRQACRQLWQQGVLERKALFMLKANAAPIVRTASSATVSATALSPQEALMQTIAAQMLNLPDPSAIDVQIPLTEQGMSSLTAVEFCQRYEQATQEELSITQLFNHPSIAELCQVRAANIDSNTTLDEAFAQNPDASARDLHALRNYLLHNRHERGGFRLGDWCVRPATIGDVPELHRLDQQEYGWLGEAATDTQDFIQHQVETLNYYQQQSGTPWFWVLEKRDRSDKRKPGAIMGWYIMQPTNKSPETITSWADATDNGSFAATFDPDGEHLYLVAGGISREYTKQAHRLMVLNALSLMERHDIRSAFACLAMPGYSAAYASDDYEPHEYLALTYDNGMPRDAFLAFFKDLWPAQHRPMRLLLNGYPPDQRSGGHGACACVDVANHHEAISKLFDKLVQQRVALFGHSNHRPSGQEASDALTVSA